MLNREHWIYRYPEGFLRQLKQPAWSDTNGSQYTFGDILSGTLWFKHAMKERGIIENSRVILFVQPGFKLVCALNAIYSIGATAVFIDPWLPRHKAIGLVRQLEGDVWLVDAIFNPLIRLLRPFLGTKKWVIDTIGSMDAKEWTIDKRNALSAAFLSFTSGSTGQPKIVKRSYAFLSAQFIVAQKYWGESPMKESSPFFVAMMAALRLGNPTFYLSQNTVQSPEAGELVYSQIQKEKVQRIFVAPRLWEQLLVQIENTNVPVSLKHVIVGGAPISRAVIKRSLKYNVDFNGQLVYGSTEVEPIALCSFEDYFNATEDPKLGIYTGKPIDEITLKLIAPSIHPQNSTALKQETEIGEVTVCGSHVCAEYHASEIDFKRNKIVDEEGRIWHRTGDIGQMREGHLYLLGRINRIMYKNGTAHYPFPLEMSVQTYTSHTDVGVVQLPNGEIMCCIGGCTANLEQKTDWQSLAIAHNWPFDAVVLLKHALPRDERHQSKLAASLLIAQLSSPFSRWYRKKTIYLRKSHANRS